MRAGAKIGSGLLGLVILGIIIGNSSSGSSGGSGGATPAPAGSSAASGSPEVSGSPAVSGAPPSSSAPTTITYAVTGTQDDAQVSYGPAGTNLSGSVPMTVNATIGSTVAAYYAISAQLQGYGDVSCTISIDGQVISRGTASGDYNIAQCEIGQNYQGAWVSYQG
jgi:hypothetical protein